jgi:Peptidase of plants and bacteria/F5/8 type C domain
MLPLLTFAMFLSPVSSTVESSLPTNGPHIRQLAYDGDGATYFASKGNPRADDHVTIAFDRIVELKSLSVATGTKEGENGLSDGMLEISTDGKTFQSAASFVNGNAKTTSPRAARAVRIRVTKDQEFALAVREIAIESSPSVPTFRFPIEFELDVADAPEMKAWAEKVIRVCERHYPMICVELASEGFKPTTRIHIALKKNYKGVAEASGNRIRGSVDYFAKNPNDVGAMIHETVHCVQLYRQRNMPGWLVEGIADYVRFWKYEPGKAGRVRPEQARYDGSYRTTATFLAFVTEKYDPKLVTKLNAILREGKYDGETWKTLTGKPIEELNQEWRRSLVR